MSTASFPPTRKRNLFSIDNAVSRRPTDLSHVGKNRYNRTKKARGKTPRAYNEVIPKTLPRSELLNGGKLNGNLVALNEQAEDMFFQMVKELVEKEGILETLFGAANERNLRIATEFVQADIIFQ